MTQTAVLVLLSALYVAQNVLSYELLQKLPLGMGIADIESIEWDATNSQYLVASWYFGVIIPFSEDTIHTQSFPLNVSAYDTVLEGFPVNTWRSASAAAGTPFDNTGFIANNALRWRPFGTEVVNDILYVVDFYFGRVAAWDIATATYINSTFINNILGFGANLDGLCHDPDHRNMLYTTDFGAKVDIAGNLLPTGLEAVYWLNTDDWSYGTIYTANTSVSGAETNTTIRPNGCVVVNGILYTVDFDIEHSQNAAWSKYNIANDEWSVEYDILPENGGDGLVYVDVIETFFATDYVSGTLVKYSPKEDDAFVVVFDGMNGPADMAYNDKLRVLAIPELSTGLVNFIALDDSLFLTTTEYLTTLSLIQSTLEKTTTKPDDIIVDKAALIGVILTSVMSCMIVGVGCWLKRLFLSQSPNKKYSIVVDTEADYDGVDIDASENI